MRQPSDFLKEYLTSAPVALATERCLECSILSQQARYQNMLDLGCGDGIFGKIFFGEQKIQCGVDPDLTELERAKKLGVYNELLGVGGQGIPKPDNSIELVISNSVLEHIPDLQSVLLECHRILKPGGYAYFTIPTSNFERYSLINRGLEILGLDGLSKKFRKFFNRFWAHYHCYDIPTWKKLFESSGFQVEETIGYASARTCLQNDFFAYMALPAAVARKIFKRWFFFPKLRELLVPVIYPLVSSSLPKDPKVDLEKAGLVFFRLKK